VSRDVVMVYPEPPTGTRLVLMSEDLLATLGTRSLTGRLLTFEWGEPDEHGWYTPTVTEKEDQFSRDAELGREVRELVELYQRNSR
jgi:hypothetical protein